MLAATGADGRCGDLLYSARYPQIEIKACAQGSLSVPVTYYTPEVDQYSLIPGYRMPFADIFTACEQEF